MNILGVKFKELLNSFLIVLKEGHFIEVNLNWACEIDSGSRLLIIALLVGIKKKYLWKTRNHQNLYNFTEFKKRENKSSSWLYWY